MSPWASQTAISSGIEMLYAKKKAKIIDIGANTTQSVAASSMKAVRVGSTNIV